MTQNSINVTASTGAPIKVNVIASESQGAVTLSQDTSAYNAEIARQWAISDKMVLQEDYSSKYYANKAKDSENSAKNYANVAEIVYNNIQDSANGVIADIETARVEAVDNITTIKSESIASVEAKSNESINELETIAEQNIEEIIIEKNNSITNIQEISATEQAELEEIKEGIINYAGIYYEEITDEVVDVNLLESGYVSDSELEEALATKQDKGDYALASDIPDLTGYVKNTDYASADKGGVVKINTTAFGVALNNSKQVYIFKADNSDITKKSSHYRPIVPTNLDLAVKTGVTTNTIELSTDEKANAKQWLGYADNTDIMQAIASIPQFKLSIIDELPTTGEKMTLYLVPKEGTNNDVYDEYIWIEQTESFEHLGTTAVDLTDYVKKTDYAGDNAGVIKRSGTYGTVMSSGYLMAGESSLEQYKTRANAYFIGKGTLESIKNDLVKRAVTANDIELTDDEKTSARTWLGAVGKTEFATDGKVGVIKGSGSTGLYCNASGNLVTSAASLEAYKAKPIAYVIGKGTLENVLTQYSKTVLTTEADYNALTTKDANTLYLIEE